MAFPARRLLLLAALLRVTLGQFQAAPDPRAKRSLTTICVEIKPSGPQEEPYFMCRGTDLSPIAGGSGFPQYSPTAAQPTNYPAPQPSYPLDKSFNSVPAVPQGQFPAASYQGAGAAPPRESYQKFQMSFQDLMPYGQQSFRSQYDNVRSAGVRPYYPQSAPSFGVQQRQPPPPAVLPPAAAPNRAPIQAHGRPDVPTVLPAAGPTDGDAKAAHDHQQSNLSPGYGKSAAQPASGGPSASSAPAGAFGTPTNGAAAMATAPAVPAALAPRKEFVAPADARQAAAMRPAAASAPPGQRNVHALPFGAANVRPQAADAPPPTNLERYRAIDDAVMGEPNWEFSPAEFGMEPPPRHPQDDPDPVMQQFYASLPPRPLVREEPLLASERRLITEGEAYLAELAELEEAKKRAERASTPRPELQYAYSLPGYAQSQLCPQPAPHPPPAAYAPVGCSGCSSYAPMPYSPPAPYSNNCHQKLPPYQPVFVMLPCYGQHAPQPPSQLPPPPPGYADGYGVPAANEVVGMTWPPPNLFGPFSSFGLMPFGGSLYGTSPLFPLLGANNAARSSMGHPPPVNAIASPQFHQPRRMPDQVAPLQDSIVSATLAMPHNREMDTNAAMTTTTTTTTTTSQAASATESDESTESAEEPDDGDISQYGKLDFGKTTTKATPLAKQQSTESSALDASLFADDSSVTSNLESESKKTYQVMLGAARQFAEIARSERQSEAKRLGRRPAQSDFVHQKRKYLQQ